MADFSRSAVEIKQGNLTLYLTYVTPRDLFGGNFYAVEKLDSDTQEGYQRILNETRARRLSRHLTEANGDGYAHLPTTVFLATDKSVDFDEDTQTLKFDKNLVCPFSVVDGQHRIEGLRLAVDREPELLDFKLPVTLATELDDTHQMYHFFIVNTTQVPVDSALRQQITRRFTDMQGVEELPYTPHWIKSSIARGRDAKALRITEFLNEHSESPFLGRIQMANDQDGRNKIKQAAIVNMLKSEVLTASNPLSVQETDIDRAARIMLNYFRAIDDLFVNGRDRNATVVYKSNGIFFFLGVSKWIFNVLYSSTNDFTTKSISSVIKASLDEIDDTYRSVISPDWWMPGPHGASNLNRAAVRGYIDAFQQALSRAPPKGRRYACEDWRAKTGDKQPSAISAIREPARSPAIGLLHIGEHQRRCDIHRPKRQPMPAHAAALGQPAHDRPNRARRSQLVLLRPMARARNSRC